MCENVRFTNLLPVVAGLPVVMLAPRESPDFVHGAEAVLPGQAKDIHDMGAEGRPVH